ncbi:MAG: cupin domain-containing protein [Gemmatimonadota bacterium]|nr:cupin domain-containing protein [Gemmatimonadota bacterium]
MRHHMLCAVALALSAKVAGAQRADTTIEHARAFTAAPTTATVRATEKKRRRLDFIDAATLNDKSARLVKYRAIGMTVFTSDDEQTTYKLVRRIVSSEPEVHARWDDLVIVRSGTGAIQMGDSLSGSTFRAPGERRGGRFAKSYELVVHAGDIVKIPAAVPHAFLVAGPEPLEYLLIKQRRQELPVRWFGER